MTHVCFARPGPPNLTISLQNEHSPQSACLHASHFLHLVRLLLGPDEEPEVVPDFLNVLTLVLESPEFL